MDPLDWTEQEDLTQFFRRNKTRMSTMENPQTFLRQMRDHHLIPEDGYKRVSRMRSKIRLQTGLYELLDWLERNRSQHITVFWDCVFKDHIMNQYPILRELRNSLMDGTYRYNKQLPERVEEEETDKGRRKDLSEDEAGEKKQRNPVRKKRKMRRSGCNEEEEEEPGPSSKLISCQKRKSKKIAFSPQKKGEKCDIWTWPIYKQNLPVTCGNQKGTLNRDKLAKGEKCLVAEKKWFSPSQFERFAGKGSYKNWKLSIRCNDTPLGTLIKEGHLKSVRCKRSKATVSLSSPDQSPTGREGEDGSEESDVDDEDQASTPSKGSSSEDEEGRTENQPESSHDSSDKVFEVTCGALTGTLHTKRFATGDRGKSIRTEKSWMTPVEFSREASGQADVSWKKEIKYRGEPICVLIEAKILLIHSPLCECNVCRQKAKVQENERNDDECFICKRRGKLVECDSCPRSFHQECHLPRVENDILGDDNQWACTFCVFRSIQGCYYSEELEWDAAMSCKISQHMHICHYLLLLLWSADQEQIFAENPTLFLEGYSVIKSPMWLGQVANRLQTLSYETVGEFVSDVQLIFTNCELYNKENAEFLAKGKRLKKIFDTEFKSVFHIREQTED